MRGKKGELLQDRRPQWVKLVAAKEERGRVWEEGRIPGQKGQTVGLVCGRQKREGACVDRKPDCGTNGSVSGVLFAAVKAERGHVRLERRIAGQGAWLWVMM